MDKIPILKMGEYLLVSIQVDMDDRLVMSLQDALTADIVKNHSKGVLIDISSLDMVDSFIGRMLSTISSMSHILGAETVVVGMQPAVAITIIELGMSLKNVHTALNVEKGFELLKMKIIEKQDADNQARST
jgi:rsbT antagonist protein RsbS